MRGTPTPNPVARHADSIADVLLTLETSLQFVPGTMASLIGEVRGMALLRTRRMPIFEMTVGQGLGKVNCMWFHGTYLKDRFQSGQMVALYGKVEPSRSKTRFKMIQPQFELLPDDH